MLAHRPFVDQELEFLRDVKRKNPGLYKAISPKLIGYKELLHKAHEKTIRHQSNPEYYKLDAWFKDVSNIMISAKRIAMQLRTQYMGLRVLEAYRNIIEEESKFLEVIRV